MYKFNVSSSSYDTKKHDTFYGTIGAAFLDMNEEKMNYREYLYEPI